MTKSVVEFEIVKLIRARRRALKIPQNKIATALGVTRGYIGQVEMESSPSMYSYNQLNQLAKLLNCSMKDFIPDTVIDF